MADEAFEHPRLAPLYDWFDDDRRDLDAYLAIAADVEGRRVLDVGCGTGTFALLLAERGFEVTALDPAQASLDVARAKPGADRVRWVQGDASAVPPRLRVDLVTMTGNVAQAIVEPEEWQQTLRATHAALRPGGRLVFETRDPADRGWEAWTRDSTHRSVEIPSVGRVEHWVELTNVSLPLVGFEATFVFHVDGAKLTSNSTLRFRERGEIGTQLHAVGFVVDEVRDAPDRPGRELVFVARRP